VSVWLIPAPGEKVSVGALVPKYRPVNVTLFVLPAVQSLGSIPVRFDHQP
jgi:hypothetical protein